VRSPSKATAAAPHGEKTLSGVAEVLAALGTQERRLAAMKEDNRATLRAASEAQKAVDYIMERTARPRTDRCFHGRYRLCDHA
jgi:antirestriction protein ArdC